MRRVIAVAGLIVMIAGVSVPADAFFQDNTDGSDQQSTERTRDRDASRDAPDRSDETRQGASDHDTDPSSRSNQTDQSIMKDKPLRPDRSEQTDRDNQSASMNESTDRVALVEWDARTDLEKQISESTNLTLYQKNLLKDLLRRDIMTADDIAVTTETSVDTNVTVNIKTNDKTIEKTTLKKHVVSVNADGKTDPLYGLLDSSKGLFTVDGPVDHAPANGSGHDVPIGEAVRFFMPDDWTVKTQYLDGDGPRVTWSQRYVWQHLLHRYSVEHELSVSVNAFDKVVSIEPAPYTPLRLFAGETVMTALKRWVDRRDWKLVWDAKYDYEVPVSTDLDVDLLKSAKTLNESLKGSGIPVRLKAYKNNVIRGQDYP